MLISDIYKILHSGDTDKSLRLFHIFYNTKENLIKKDDLLNCLLGLGEIYMKKKDFNKAKKYYIEGYKLSSGKDFNILFNLGVLFSKLGEKDKSILFLNKAKKNDPSSDKLQKYLKNINNDYKTHLKDIYEFKDNNGNLKLQIVFRLTLNCNQRCIFCNVVNGNNSIEKNIIFNIIKDDIFLTLQKYDNLLKQNIEIVLSGGEPTLHNEFWKIIDYVLDKAGEVVIQTNGVMFNEEIFITGLKERKDKKISFYISFHSHIEDFYNKITQTNQYIKAIKGIINILSVKKHISQINFVFNKYNINTFSKYLIFIKENFISINPYLSLNISSITGVNTSENLIKYSDILDNIYSSLDYIKNNNINISGLTPGGAMCDLPFCVYSKYIDLNIELKDEKLFVVDKLDINNIKLDSCNKCILNKNCPGILKVYIEKY